MLYFKFSWFLTYFVDDEQEEDDSIPSRSTGESSSGWFSKTTPPKHLRQNGDTNSWESSNYSQSNSSQSSFVSSEQSRTQHTCGRSKERRRKQRAVAIPEEYQNKTYVKPKPTKTKHTCRRRIKQLASSSDEDEETPVSVLDSPNKSAKKQETVTLVSSDDEEDVNSDANSRTKTPIEEEDGDEEDGGGGAAAEFFDDEMPTFNKLVLSFFNDATIEELVGIDECSKSKAQKIVAMRPFDDFADLVSAVLFSPHITLLKVGVTLKPNLRLTASSVQLSLFRAKETGWNRTEPPVNQQLGFEAVPY